MPRSSELPDDPPADYEPPPMPEISDVFAATEEDQLQADHEKELINAGVEGVGEELDE